MIIFGSRMYGSRAHVHGWGSCDHCGNYGSHRSYNGRKFGHLYFIPLIPMGPPVRVIKECKRCSTGLHLPEEHANEVLEDIKGRTKQALTALLEGRDEFFDGESTVSTVGFLAGAVEMLHCLNADDHVHLILAALKKQELHHPASVVEGKLWEFQGKLDQALQAYQHAMQDQPNDRTPYYLAGKVALLNKEPDKARQFLEHALNLSDDRVAIQIALLDVYETLKDHEMMANTCEDLMVALPDLATEKDFLRSYKKACKKIGRDPNAIQNR